MTASTKRSVWAVSSGTTPFESSYSVGGWWSFEFHKCLNGVFGEPPKRFSCTLHNILLKFKRWRFSLGNGALVLCGDNWLESSGHQVGSAILFWIPIGKSSLWDSDVSMLDERDVFIEVSASVASRIAVRFRVMDELGWSAEHGRYWVWLCATDTLVHCFSDCHTIWLIRSDEPIRE